VKKIILRMGVVFLVTAVAVCVISCGGEGGGGVTVTLAFVNRLSGDPVPGVVAYVNGEAKTAGVDGKVSSSAEGPLRLEGYVDPAALWDLGYTMFGPPFVYWYFAFTVQQSFTRTLILEPMPAMPDSRGTAAITGSVETKTGVGTIASGMIEIYSSDGRMLNTGPISISDGTYSGTVYDTGTLYFLVYDIGTGEIYYTTAAVTESDTYDLAYDGADITLAGDVSDTAYEVFAYLVLGEELVELNSVELESPFSIDVPHRGTDRIMLMAEGGDPEGLVYCFSEGYSAAASGIDLSFASGSTVPAEWDSGFDMTGPRTFSWNAAGNANGYYLEIEGVEEGGILFAFVEGTSLTIDESIGLAWIEGASITPIRTEGYVGMIASVFPPFRFVPASLIRGTTKYYLALQDEWGSEPPITD